MMPPSRTRSMNSMSLAATSPLRRAAQSRICRNGYLCDGSAVVTFSRARIPFASAPAESTVALLDVANHSWRYIRLLDDTKSIPGYLAPHPVPAPHLAQRALRSRSALVVNHLLMLNCNSHIHDRCAAACPKSGRTTQLRNKPNLLPGRNTSLNISLLVCLLPCCFSCRSLDSR